MKIDLTITISVILGISAILSPIVVSIINNKYQLKLKELENFEFTKIKALENFSQNAGTHISFLTGRSEKDFLNSLYALLPYFKIKDSDIDLLVENSFDKDLLITETRKLIISLSKQIDKKK